MLVSDFDYELPEELIAQQPRAERGSSRMLVVSRERQSFHDDQFSNFHRYIRSGDCLVFNETRVFPARLMGRRNHADGAEIEVFLTGVPDGSWTTCQALVRPAKRVRTGDRILFEQDLSGEIVAEGEYGERTIRFESDKSIEEVIDQIGSVPLPPYIHRRPEKADRERYQTVFARNKGSVAAPTAGLHFTPDMVTACAEAGAEICYVSLHVGLGTFAPLREREVEKVQLHAERFQIDDETAERIRRAKRVFCVGTTSVRAVESMQHLSQLRGETRLFISPGFTFGVVGAMLTNFHLPQSSLLMLVSAFAGPELTLAAYRHAVREKYQFFSYGDCMLID